MLPAPFNYVVLVVGQDVGWAEFVGFAFFANVVFWLHISILKGAIQTCTFNLLLKAWL